MTGKTLSPQAERELREVVRRVMGEQGAVNNPINRRHVVRDEISLLRFRLKTGQTLAPLGSALARILTWDTDTSSWVEGDTDVTVREPYTTAAGQFRAFSQYEGWCVHRSGTTYDIVEMEHSAEIAVFELTSAFGYTTANTATAEVVEWTNGRAPQEEITVYDPLGRFNRALPRTIDRVGAKGVAIYDYVSDKFIAVRCEQQAIFGTATAVQMCPDSTEPIQVSDFRVLPYGEFVQTPDPLPLAYADGLRNPFSHAAAASTGGVMLQWDETLEPGGVWRVYDATKIGQTLVTDVYIATEGSVKKLKKKTLKMYAETCATETPSDIIDLAECPPPE